MPDRFDIIRDDLARARKRGKLGVFGEESHGYRMSPPLSEGELRAFESGRGVRLPEDYRQFLARVGNGGAGPYYGVFRLGEIDDGHGHMVWDEFSVGRLSAPFPHREAWNDLAGQPDPALADSDEAEYERLLEAYEARYFSPRLMDGAIPICHLGCALRHWLVLGGAEAGNVWCDARADEEGVRPLSGAGRARVGFFEWYRGWLDGVVAKAAGR